MNLASINDVVPPPPDDGGGQSRRQCILASASGEESSCSCGTWYCCSKGIREMQEFAEKFYWSSPVLSSPPIPPVPPIQRPLTSGAEAEEEEEISRETDDTVGKIVDKEGDQDHHDENEEDGRSADIPIDVYEKEGGGSYGVIGGGDGGENMEEETDQQGNNSMDYFDCSFYDELPPPDLENMVDFIQGAAPPEAPPVLDVEMNEENEERQLPVVQREDEPFDLHNLNQVSPQPPFPTLEATIEPPPPTLAPAFVVQSTPPPKLTVQKLINFVRNSPRYDQTISKTAHPLPPPSPPLPILEISTAPPQAQRTPNQPPPNLTVQNQNLINFIENPPSSSRNPPALEVNPPPSGNPFTLEANPPPSGIPPTLEANPPSSGNPPTLEANPPSSGNPPTLEANPSTPPSRRRRHSSRKKSSTVFQCPVTSCGKFFYRPTALATHEKEHNLGKNLPFFCEICKSSYVSQTNFDMHLWRHRNCKGCGAQLKNAPVSKSSSSSSPMDSYCDTCAKNLEKSPPPSLSKQSSDNGHQDQEDDEEEENGEDDDSSPKLWCKVCRKSFTYKKRLEAHMLLVHKVDTSVAHVKSPEENEKFQCSVCDKWFRLQNHLDVHMSVHKSDEEEFTCVICKKPFGSQRGLRAHQRSKSVCYYKMQRMEKNKN